MGLAGAEIVTCHTAQTCRLFCSFGQLKCLLSSLIKDVVKPPRMVLSSVRLLSSDSDCFKQLQCAHCEVLNQWKLVFASAKLHKLRHEGRSDFVDVGGTGGRC
jgi:hypothetical protein